MKRPSSQNLNSIVSRAMADISSTQRFPGDLNASYRKIMTNLMPFRLLKFFSIGYGPFSSQPEYRICNKVADFLHRQLMHKDNLLMRLPSYYRGLTLSSFFIFRGNFGAADLSKSLFSKYNKTVRAYYAYRRQQELNFQRVPYLNENYSLTLVYEAPPAQPQSGVMIQNCTNISAKLDNIR